MDQGTVRWKKEVREALYCVDELVSQQIFPPQVTLAAHQLSDRDGNYPITLEEAIDFFRNDLPFVDEIQKPNQETKSPVLSLSNISVKYKTFRKQNKVALNNITTSFYKGDQVALVGNNGAGKSSLLKTLSGIVKPSEGKMEFLEGSFNNQYSPETLSDHVAFVFQNPEEMFIDDSVRKEIEYYLKARKVENMDVLVDQLLEDFDLVHLQDQDARLLSGGQQRRVSLAIGAAMSPSIIILDEPTANLDMATKNKVISMLDRLKKHVDTIIIATHDMQLVAEWSNRILVMHAGELIADDVSEVIFKQHEMLEKAGLVPPQILTLCNELDFPYCATVDSFVESIKQGKERGVLHGAW